MHIRMRHLTVIVMSVTAGCGGGGNEPEPVLPRLEIRWAARSREIIAPSSALSVTVTLEKAKPDGGDLIAQLDRRTNPAAYTDFITTTVPVVPGPYDLSARFFAEANGAGSLVGVAQGRVIVERDGSIPTSLTTVGAVAQAETFAPLFYEDETVTPAFRAYDASHNIVAVTPGSVFFALPIGGEHARITGDGLLEGISPGPAALTVTIDGKTSPAVQFKVLSRGKYDIVQLAPNYDHNDPVSAGLAINASGLTTGYRYYWTKEGSLQIASIWSAGGAVTELRVPILWLPGVTPLRAISAGTAIDTSGRVAGYYLNGENETTALDHIVAFLWSGGAFTELPSLGGSNSYAYGMNDLGQIVGSSQTADGVTHAVSWQAGAAQDLGPGAAYEVNASGVIVGVVNLRTVLWSSLGAQPQVIVPARSAPHQINDAGTVVGEMRGADLKDHAYSWSGGALVDLGLGKAYGINRLGDIVGTSEGRAVLWRAGEKVDLTALVPEPYDPEVGPVWELTEARAVNDSGQIAGIGIIRGREGRGARFVGFMMTPRPARSRTIRSLSGQ